MLLLYLSSMVKSSGVHRGRPCSCRSRSVTISSADSTRAVGMADSTKRRVAAKAPQ